VTLEETVRRIERKLEQIEAEIDKMRRQMLEDFLATEHRLISLPDHLRKTAMGLIEVGQGSARDVCRVTNRSRAVESNYLNQLEREGFVKSFRVGRRKVFQMEENVRKI
jgi:Mg2+ and Co2+ transporter CorA